MVNCNVKDFGAVGDGKTLNTAFIQKAIAFCICSLVSCSGGIKRGEAKAQINDFFAAVSEEDYEKAQTLLHPDRPADLEKFFSRAEDEENIDFQKGIKILRYTGFSSSYYDTTVDGSAYELTMMTSVGEQEVEFVIEVVKNEKGFGIYNLDLDTTP